ncbi:DUF5694 domain-containing protein [Priestia koreensis]|uniref:Uncharacterized protein n=1 Tax=Priestia koreensis TaxID=284581 RepID=A0A0M0L6Z5_9BACI|nr:DUF5694 domain-containing protein [Priestia koreensis]KOO46438.1 hypothetical protein AMD01_11455 [Priestia koreensis]
MKKPTIMLLGTYHFDTSTVSDYKVTEEMDIFSDTKQNEIQEVLEKLSAFAPTKIILEYPSKAQKELSKTYESYRKGELKPQKNEIYQLGYKLADMLGHDTIYAGDLNEEEGIPDIFSFIDEDSSDIAEKIKDFFDKWLKEANQKLSSTVCDSLTFMNEPAYVKSMHQIYIDMSLLEYNGEPIGAKWVMHYWYYRNMLIYKKIVGLTTDPDDRILVIYGAGHLYLLQQFCQEGDRFIIENPTTYLTSAVTVNR